MPIATLRVMTALMLFFACAGAHAAVAQPLTLDTSGVALRDATRCYAILALIDENGASSDALRTLEGAFLDRSQMLLRQPGAIEVFADLVALSRATALRYQTLQGWMRQAGICWSNIDTAYGQLRTNAAFAAAGECWASRASSHDKSPDVFFLEFDIAQAFSAAGIAKELADEMTLVVYEQSLSLAVGPDGPQIAAASKGCFGRTAALLRRLAYPVSPSAVADADWAAFRASREMERAAVCAAIDPLASSDNAKQSFASAKLGSFAPIVADMGERLDRMGAGRDHAARACSDWTAGNSPLP
jgi:hypothetical protein